LRKITSPYINSFARRGNPDSVAPMSWAFFRESLCNWRDTGAVAPSSLHLAQRMVAVAGVCQAGAVLELGPGTGAITQAIAEALPQSSHYLGLELNGSFVERLRGRFPLLRFEQAPAQEFDFDGTLGTDGYFDSIVSGLPWTAFPEGLQIAILDHVLSRLRPGGIFTTFAYTGFHLLPAGRHFRALLADRCESLTTTTTVWRNMPPAFVYAARAGARDRLHSAVVG
jgi:phosphatidylethanolamine/phosphatidyl-N-methylethanolamine N-methyltransferase